MKERRFWAVICEKWLTYYSNRTDYPSGFINMKMWPAAHFFDKVWKSPHKKWRKQIFVMGELHGCDSSATHRQTWWGLMIEWCMCDIAAAIAIWVSMDLDEFRANSVGRPISSRHQSGRSANNSLHDARARLKISSQKLSWQRSFCTIT